MVSDGVGGVCIKTAIMVSGLRERAHVCVCVRVHVFPGSARARIIYTRVCRGMRRNVCFERGRQRALTRQALMHVFIRARGEAERAGQ